MLDRLWKVSARYSWAPFSIPLALMLTACASRSAIDQTRQAGFGPMPPSPISIKSVDLEPANVAKAHYLQALSTRVSLSVTRARVDVPEALVRNSESSLVVSSYANATEGDQLIVAWMQMRPGANGEDSTSIRSAQSNNSGQDWLSTGVTLAPGDAGEIGFDPAVSADPETGFAAIAGMVSNYTTGVTANPIWVARKSSRHAAFGAPIALSGVPSNSFDRQWLSTARINGETTTVLMASRAPRYWSSVGTLPFTVIEQATHCTGVYPALTANGKLHIACLQSSASNGFYTYSTTPKIGGSFSSFQIAHPTAPSPGVPEAAIFRAIPGKFRFSYLPVFAVDSVRNRVYFPTSLLNESVASGNVDIALAISANGQTFSAPMIVNTNPLPSSDQFAPMISVDPAGGVHLAYFDSSAYPQADDAQSALLDVIYAYSADGGITWVESKVNETPIDTSNTAWAYPPGGRFDQFIGDYIGIASSPSAAYISYPRTEANQMGLEVARIERPSTSLFGNGFEGGALKGFLQVYGKAAEPRSLHAVGKTLD